MRGVEILDQIRTRTAEALAQAQAGNAADALEALSLCHRFSDDFYLANCPEVLRNQALENQLRAVIAEFHEPHAAVRDALVPLVGGNDDLLFALCHLRAAELASDLGAVEARLNLASTRVLRARRDEAVDSERFEAFRLRFETLRARLGDYVNVAPVKPL